MAAPPRPQAVSNTPLHNKYPDEEDVTETRLPSGGCNFRNLDAGGDAPTCGCKRFWDKTLAAPEIEHGSGISRSQARPGFCMCTHHACYHDEGSTSGPRHFIRASVTPRMSTVQDAPQRPELGGQGPLSDEGTQFGQPHSTLPDTLRFSHYVHTGSSFGLPAIPSQCLLPSDNGSITSGSQARYSRPFGGLGLGTLSHIPTPGAGDNIQPKPQAKERRMQIYQDVHGNDCLQSLTEGATPSAQQSQDPMDPGYEENITDVQIALEGLVKKRSQGHSSVAFRPMSKGSTSAAMKQSASHPAVALSDISDVEDERYLIPRLRVLVGHMSDFPNKIQNHETRIGLLENTSFTNPVIDGIGADLDRVDTRISDFEDRLLEVEKHATINDASSVGSKRLVNTSFESRASTTSSAMIASALDRIDPSRIEALEAQVAELQNTLPSHSRPWKVEVVFVPYGSSLKGIWSTQHATTQRSRLHSSATDPWTQTQYTSGLAQAQLTAHEQTSAWETSATSFGEPEDNRWLIARACGQGSRIYERLRSRGLVKTLQIMGSSWSDVNGAMLDAFGDISMILRGNPGAVRGANNYGSIPGQLQSYLGLQSPWIPLRKVHKDSCLRFLTPYEMSTQALWNVPFLTSSVAMRQKDIRRLYVTQSDAYLQHLLEEASDWTWQKLRQLPRFYPEQQNNHTPEADAHEPCWNFDDRLDPVDESFQSSFASHISSLSLRSPAMDNDHELVPASPSDHFSSAPVSPNASTTPTSLAPTNNAPLSPVRERHPFRPIHTRTLSMPSMATLSNSQTGKRRITSFEQEVHPVSSPSHVPATSVTNTHLHLKRRRISRSPSRPRDTPRYSAEPPSPYVHNDEISGLKRERGMTPFAYATPHSNAPYVSRPRSGISIYEDEDEDEKHLEDRGSATNQDDIYENKGGEANALSDFDLDEAEHPEQEHQLEDEWEGVQDEDMPDEQKYITTRYAASADDDNESEASSAPSMYPSTQQPDHHQHQNLFSVSTKAGFRIHVDEDPDETGNTV